jgi:hypothetical protein
MYRDQEKKASPFERFFREEDIKISLAKAGCQLTDTDGHCKFEHRSIMHYFVAKALYEELLAFQADPFKEVTDKLILGKKVLIGRDTEIYEFLVEMVRTGQETVIAKKSNFMKQKLYDFFAEHAFEIEDDNRINNYGKTKIVNIDMFKDD